ncbi:MAG: hypothetical protein WEC75_02660 [Dehalococcoidia bacterium]
MPRRTLRWILVAGLFLGLGLVAACDGSSDDDDASDGDETAIATQASAPPTPDDEADPTPADEADGEDTEPAAGEEGSARVVADGEETTLGVDDCLVPDGNGPIIVVATSADGEASLSLGGIAATATIEFNRAGQQWLGVGAPLVIEGSTITYDGPALKTGATPPETEISVEVVCT